MSVCKYEVIATPTGSTLFPVPDEPERACTVCSAVHTYVSEPKEGGLYLRRATCEEMHASKR